MKPRLIWIKPTDCDPPHGLDLQWKHDSDKVADLERQFRQEGFSLQKPALVGYPKDGRIQLLSGTHRHLAAICADIMLPVTMWLRSYVEAAWGTEHWDDIIRDIPVSDLCNVSSGDLWDNLKNIPEFDQSFSYRD